MLVLKYLVVIILFLQDGYFTVESVGLRGSLFYGLYVVIIWM